MFAMSRALAFLALLSLAVGCLSGVETASEPTVEPLGPTIPQKFAVGERDTFSEPDPDPGPALGPPVLVSDQTGTINTGQTVTFSLSGGPVSGIAWQLDGSETQDDGVSTQQARWSEPGTYLVSASADQANGTPWNASQTIEVVDLTLGIGIIPCGDGSWEPELTLSGTNSGNEYQFWGANDFTSPSWELTVVVDGQEGSTTVDGCNGVLGDSNSGVFAATVVENPDGDEWTTGEEQFQSGTDPWIPEVPQNCLLIEEDGTWSNWGTSAVVCQDYFGVVSGCVV